jgi:hypothetical protein
MAGYILFFFLEVSTASDFSQKTRKYILEYFIKPAEHYSKQDIHLWCEKIIYLS